MSVTIQPMGMLKNYTGGEGKLYLPAELTVHQVLVEIGIPPDVVALVVVNGEIRPKDYLLQEGDYVKLMAVIGGGSGLSLTLEQIYN
jgi:sulfur carrier protein ThiS